MATPFYTDLLTDELPITSLFMEYVTTHLAAMPADEREDRFYELLTTGLQVCDVTKGAPTDTQVEDVARRISERAQEKEDDASPSKSGAGRFFAGYLTEWAGKLDPTALCLYAANYDYWLARRYYCELDQQTLAAIARNKLQLEFERARATFEASLFGFGGKYKDTPSGADSEFDLSKDDKAAEMALRSFGF